MRLFLIRHAQSLTNVRWDNIVESRQMNSRLTDLGHAQAKDLADWLPEVADLPALRREAVDAATSFETWNRLRSHQGLSVKASMDVVYEILRLTFGLK